MMHYPPGRHSGAGRNPVYVNSSGPPASAGVTATSSDIFLKLMTLNDEMEHLGRISREN